GGPVGAHLPARRWGGGGRRERARRRGPGQTGRPRRARGGAASGPAAARKSEGRRERRGGAGAGRGRAARELCRLGNRRGSARVTVPRGHVVPSAGDGLSGPAPAPSLECGGSTPLWRVCSLQSGVEP